MLEAGIGRLKSGTITSKKYACTDNVRRGLTADWTNAEAFIFKSTLAQTTVIERFYKAYDDIICSNIATAGGFGTTFRYCHEDAFTIL